MTAYLRLANAHVLNQELELAVDTLQNALKINPQSKAVRRALARIYVIRKDYTAAENQLREILEIDPDDRVARADIGDFLLDQDDFEGAEKEYMMIEQAHKHKIFNKNSVIN